MTDAYCYWLYFPDKGPPVRLDMPGSLRHIRGRAERWKRGEINQNELDLFGRSFVRSVFLREGILKWGLRGFPTPPSPYR